MHPRSQHTHRRAGLQLGLDPDPDSRGSWLQPSTASASHTQAGLRTPRRLVKTQATGPQAWGLWLSQCEVSPKNLDAGPIPGDTDAAGPGTPL